MGGFYGSGSGGGGFYGKSGSSSPEHHHHGLLRKIAGKVAGGAGHFVGHLASDVEHAAVGLPMGFAQMAQHPILGLEEIGKTTWQDWSPLFHGHFKQFGHNFFEHPLAPLLDVASVVTLGAGSAARGGAALSRLGVISKESRLATLGHPVDVALEGSQGTVFRHLSGNPATRLAQRASHRAVTKVAPNWRGGEYTRLIEKDTARRGVAAGHVSAGVMDAMKGVFKAGETLEHHPHEYLSVVEQTMHQNLGRFARRSTAGHVPSIVDKEGNVTLHAPKGVAFIRKEKPTTPGIEGVQDVSKNLDSFGRRHTMKKASPDQVMLDEHGNPLLVPDHNVNLLVQEAKNSTKLTRAIYHRPTHIWKWAVLTTPRFFVNNAVGNSLMAMNALNPAVFTRSLLAAIKDAHGSRVAVKAADEFDKVSMQALGHEGDVIDKWYLGPHKEGFGYEHAQTHQLYRKLEEKGRNPRLVQAVKLAEQGTFTFTHRVAEKGIRRIGIDGLLRKSPEVKELMRGGKSFRDAVDEVSHDPSFRSRMQHEMDNILGQYHYYNGFEQHLRRLVPFYGWDRAIMRHTRTMALEHPTRTAAGARVGEGGVEETKRQLGDIPSYMEGLIPLGAGKVLSTQGVNPYASVPDTVNPVLSLVGLGKHSAGESAATQMNPLLTGVIESMTGQSLLSGAKLPHRGGGVLGQTASNVVEGLPQIKLLETLLGGEKKPKPNKRTGKITNFLYRKDARSQIAALLGVPVKEINKGRAHELARKQRGEKKGRKKSGSFYG
jgi:hypothetical protein